MQMGISLFGTRIYCHNMSSEIPQEYITLPAGAEENYVVSWHNDENAMQGDVYFEKLRLQVSVNGTFNDIIRKCISMTYLFHYIV